MTDALSDEEVIRYSRTMRVQGIGASGQLALRKSRVAIVGCGGLGAPVIASLASTGIGSMTLIDADFVSLNNLQRQFIHTVLSLDSAKVDSAAKFVSGLNPGISVRVVDQYLHNDNVLETLAGHDVVVDCTDSFQSRYMLSDSCSMLGIPLVWGAVLGFEGQCSVFDALPDGSRFDLRSVFPVPPPSELAPTCSSAGVLAATCMSIGALMSAEVVKLLVGIGKPLVGRLQYVDLESGNLGVVSLPVSNRSERVQSLVDYEEFCARSTSRDGEASFEDIRRAETEEIPFVLVDLREEFEFAEDGLAAALSLPASSPDTKGELLLLSQKARLYLYCNSGNIARSVRDEIISLGAGRTAVWTIRGGTLAWRKQAPTVVP